MTRLIHRIKHADQFGYIIFVCCLQYYLLTSSLVRHNILEFVRRLNDGQRILENMNHRPEESDQRDAAPVFTPNLIQRVVRRGVLYAPKMPEEIGF